MGNHIAEEGPVSVSMDASRSSFRRYSSGIYQDKMCRPDHLDHAVLGVGYGTEDEVGHFLVKNSWGTDWGEEGYFRILRDVATCVVLQRTQTYQSPKQKN